MCIRDSIKAVLKDIGTLAAAGGILLYLDEIQYLNKKQQQSLLECCLLYTSKSCAVWALISARWSGCPLRWNRPCNTNNKTNSLP